MPRKKKDTPVEKCFKHPRRKSKYKWRVCADGPWRGVCAECDLELNKLGLKWAYPKTWRKLYNVYLKSED